MKAYNSRKTPREHYLFKEKRQKLSITHNIKHTSHIFKVFKMKDKKHIDDWIVVSGYENSLLCFEILKKIMKHTKFGFSISEKIKLVEKWNKVKIEDLGLTRDDFSRDYKELAKISESIKEYKKKNKEEN